MKKFNSVIDIWGFQIYTLEIFPV